MAKSSGRCVSTDGVIRALIRAAYVGFGMLTPAMIAVVDRLPERNTGAIIRAVNEFIFDDAAIIACLLRQWDVPTAMIGTALGDDARGHRLAQQLAEWGVQSQIRFTRQYETPIEIDISDNEGGRTYFWQRPPDVLATLKGADLSPLLGAGLLYVDWYDGEHILEAMDEARRLGVPVFLNLEHGHTDDAVLERYASRATICQAVTDAAQHSRERAMEVAQKLVRAGVRTAIVTLAAEGCMAIQGREIVRVRAPHVRAVDGCGAGATFSAGYIYGCFQGWSFQQSLSFATAAASLKVSRAGLQMFPLSEILHASESLELEQVSSLNDHTEDGGAP